MTDQELIKRLHDFGHVDAYQAAARIEELVKGRDAISEAALELNDKLAKAVEALREISSEASVPVHTWRNGINFKKMYERWRALAVKRIDRARATLAELGGKE